MVTPDDFLEGIPRNVWEIRVGIEDGTIKLELDDREALACGRNLVGQGSERLLVGCNIARVLDDKLNDTIPFHDGMKGRLNPT